MRFKLTIEYTGTRYSVRLADCSRVDADVRRSALGMIRRILLATLLAGIAGMGAELLLIGHIDDYWQLLPVGLLVAGFLTGVWHAAAPRPASVRTLQGLMLLFIGSGLLGIALHYRGNSEFELEMYPALAGFELVRKTLTGATPVLAPGSMAMLGLVGLAHAYRHPRRRRDGG